MLCVFVGMFHFALSHRPLVLSLTKHRAKGAMAEVSWQKWSWSKLIQSHPFCIAQIDYC
jgi:hypothetical protein